MKLVLSIDGGGVRGIIPAIFLSYIEERIHTTIAESFDLIVGTSIGGIISLILGSKIHRAKDVANLIENSAHIIFPRTSYHKLVSLGGMLEERYSSNNVRNVLYSIGITEHASMSVLDTKVCAVSYDTHNCVPYVFKSWKHDVSLLDVALATSAAPTYFEPVVIESISPDSCFVDGGVVANNPSMCGYAEAKKLWPEEDIVVVSFGTGNLRRNLDFDEAKDYGFIQWARPLLNIFMNGQSYVVDYQMLKLVSNNYIRLQPRLDVGSDDLDDSSNTNLLALKVLANNYIELNKNVFDRIIGVINGII